MHSSSQRLEVRVFGVRWLELLTDVPEFGIGCLGCCLPIESVQLPLVKQIGGLPGEMGVRIQRQSYAGSVVSVEI